MLSDEWLSRYGLLENFNASVTRTGTGTGTRTTGVTAIALCTSCSRAKNAPYSFLILALQKLAYIQCTEIFSAVKIHLAEAALTSTYNLCFGSKLRKIVYPYEPQFYYIKLGFKGYTFHGHVILMFLFQHSFGFNTDYCWTLDDHLRVFCYRTDPLYRALN